MKRQFLCSAVFLGSLAILATTASAQSTGTCCGKVGVGTTTISDSSGSGGQELYLDVAGAAGATYYCDENGLNCFTASSLSGGVADDSLDFTKFLDAMALDASTSITADNAEVLSIVNTGTGNSLLVEDQASDTTPFVIDAAGKVGIGTDAPAYTLDIDSSINDVLRLSSPDPRLAFVDNTGNSWYLQAVDDSYLRFGTPSGGVNSVVITKVGNVGINTTGPDRKLDVLDSSNPQLRLTHTDGSVYTDLKTTSSGYLYINPSGSNVGIGTTSPSTTLDVTGAAGAGVSGTGNIAVTDNTAIATGTGGYLLFRGNYTSGGAITSAAGIKASKVNATSGEYGFDLDFYTRENGLGNFSYPKMRITSAGNVGIGTTTINNKLEVAGGGIGITGADTSFGGGAGLSLGQQATYSRIQSWGGAPLSINPQGNNVGIGTTGPDRKLDVLDASNPQMRLTHTDGSVYTDMRTDGSGNFTITPSGSFTTFGGNYVIVNGVYLATKKITSTYFTGSQNLTLEAGTTSGSIILTPGTSGNVGIGTSSPTELLDINSSTMRLRTAKTPASAADTCDQGEIAWDTDYVYVCVATNTWKRSGLATW